ncbi:MAG: 16S rRNA (cytosine(967)-C(5))-methyltransferase RsmB [Gammaproteobacteria bacterium]|nr:16S rRNA (cytosine(967)-C(5))-methyltransferase RsmB [Gammaproteobacteria bacterium]
MALLPVRLAATKVVNRVLRHGESLGTLLPEFSERVAEKDRALLQALCFGVMRYLPKLQWLLAKLLQKPLRNKDQDVQALLLLALFQLLYMRVPEYAAVNDSVAVSKKLGKGWAKALVNGVLRNFIRRKEELLTALESDLEAHYSHPAWIIERLQHDWPEQWQSLLIAANEPPPMTLRVNVRQQSRTDYLQQLQQQGIEAEEHPHAAAALILAKPQSVSVLPRFEQGSCSVQDAAAQLAAQLLDVQPGQRILDACAAPGGKTGHILEQADDLELWALDSDQKRLDRVTENLQRLQRSAKQVCADAAETNLWWDGKPFERILLDAPCSATGVIRRHPDIKVLRRAEDIEALAAQQRRLLQALWPLLAPGGLLLYATCSLFKAENSQQIGHFLCEQSDAIELPLQADWGIADLYGRQVFTAQEGMDGFYYARLEKKRVF